MRCVVTGAVVTYRTSSTGVILHVGPHVTTGLEEASSEFVNSQSLGDEEKLEDHGDKYLEI